MSNIPVSKDKLLCALLYLGAFAPIMAWVCVGWLVVANIRKIYLKDFVRYHCYQALLFIIVAFFLPSLLATVLSFCATFLSLFVIFDNTIQLLVSLVQGLLPFYYLFIKLVGVYGIIWTFRGKYTYIPPISQAVNHLLR